MSSNSPYIPGVTARDPAMFFGRADELAQLTDAIRKGSSQAVVGLRRIGKSSLLYHLSHHTSLPDHVAIVYLDLLDANYHTAPGLLGGIWRGLQQATGRGDVPSAAPDMAAFTSAIRQMKADGY
ncbi:MAG: ATP-binding protein [Anaerolinea sp.]|nr:ATP-binding protein [Anaerolinea sp.]